MKILFMGTPEFAVPTLKKIIESSHQVVGVVTVPDKPVGRGQKISSSAVKDEALKKSLKIIQPDNLSDDDFINECKSLNPDLIVVVAFRKLPKVIWEIPKFGTFNLHASLLPQYRGAAPINWAIINGEKETGLTTFFIDENIDTGKIIKSKSITINETDNLKILHDKMSIEGAILVLDTINEVENNTYKIISQNEVIKEHNITELKKAPKILKQHCEINWNKSAKNIINLIRGLSPVPGAFSTLNNNLEKKVVLKIYDADFYHEDIKIDIGQIIFTKTEMIVGVGDDNAIIIKEVKPENKAKMDIRSFINGFKLTENWHFNKK